MFLNLLRFYPILRKTAKKWSLALSCLSVYPSAWNQLHGFSWNLGFFSKICRENWSPIKIGKKV